MSLAHSAQRAKKPQSLQVLEDLKKIKTEPTEAAESLDNEPHAAHRKQETSLDKEEHLYGNSSSSELSELEEPEPDDAPSIAENEEAQLVMKKPRTRSSRRRNTAKTYAEPDSSSEDVGEHYKGRGIVVKNTWTLNGSEESEIDSTASYTSDNSSDSSDTKSEASGFSHGIRGEETEGEMDAGLDADSLDEHSDRVQSFPLRRSDSEQGKRSKIPKAKFKYMVTHGRLNEAQRRKPWEVIAEECGVTASLEDISQALKQAGIPYGDRLGPVAHASPPAATPLQERKRSATTIVLEDSESEDIMPTPKRRRDTVPESRRTHRSPASYRRHPQNIFSRDRNSNVEKFPRLTTPLPPATALVEPVLRKSDEPLVTETPRNNANEDLFLRNGDIDVNSLPAVGKAPRPGTAARRIIAKANTTLPPTNDNISESFATSKNLATSALQKRKNMVWNFEAEHMLLLAIIEVRGYKMDYEAVAERLGCSGNAVSKHLQRLRTEIQDKNHPIPLVRPGTVIGSNARIDRLNFTEAAGLLAAKLDDSNGRSGLPKATRTKDALFVKNEIAKLEANLREDNELTPWSKEEESALERGLRRFSGPYWSDILGLFGPNGSVSDVLKDRNEAQLDNKACRMKISFLKSGVKFPFYLRMVNGDARRQRPQ